MTGPKTTTDALPQATRPNNTGASNTGASTRPTVDQSGKDIGFCLLVALAEATLVVAGISGGVTLPLSLIHISEPTRPY